jgi:hypothetical protein
MDPLVLEAHRPPLESGRNLDGNGRLVLGLRSAPIEVHVRPSVTSTRPDPT